MTQLSASSRQEIRRLEKAAKLREIHEREAIIAIMSNKPGRTWMWGHLEFAGVFQDRFLGDGLKDAHASGVRTFGLRLLSDITVHCPELFLEMLRESNERRTELNSIAERRSSEIADGGDSGAEPNPDAADDPNDTASDIYTTPRPGEPATTFNAELPTYRS